MLDWAMASGLWGSPSSTAGMADLAVPSGHAGKFKVLVDADLPNKIGVSYWGRDASNNPVMGILWTEVDTSPSLAE